MPPAPLAILGAMHGEPDDHTEPSSRRARRFNSIHERLEKFGPTLRGMLWTIAAGILFAVLNAAMRGAGRSPEVHRYEAAHGFFNERRADVYDANCAEQAWERMIAFLGKTLG